MADRDHISEAIVGFETRSAPRVIYGPDAIERIGEEVARFATGAVLLVTDAGIVAAGHAGRAQRAMEAQGLRVTVFQDVIENPTTAEVDACVAVARAAGVEAIVGIGGGSAMDTAKGCNFLLTNGGVMQDYWGVGKAAKPMLPLVLAPTTAGTGSEAQSFALIADAKTHQKMACGDPKAAARVAILDPTLTVTQPREVTAVTGIDAIAHALESAVTRRRNELSSLYSREAFRLTVTHFPVVLDDPANLAARGGMLLGACYAGMAIEQSMLGAAHAMANPLTAHFGVTHGHAVGLMLPQVVRYNSADPAAREIYGRLAGAVGMRPGAGGDAIEMLVERLESLLRLTALPPCLKECGVDAARYAELAAEAEKQWTAQFNPREIKAAQFERIYRTAHEDGAASSRRDPEAARH
jgi:alcohol dehydrogenase